MRTRIGWMGFGLGIVFSAVFLLVFGQKAISIDELKQIAATQGWVVLSKEEFQRMQAQVPLKDQPQATPNTSKEKQNGQPAISAPAGQKQPEKKPDTAPTANSEKKKLASEHDKEATKASPKMNESSKEKKKTEQSTDKSDKKTKENEKESNKTTQPAKGSSATTQQQAKDVSKQNHSSKENSEPSTSTTGEKEPAKKQEQSIEQTTNNKPGAEQKDTSGITQPVPPTPPEPPKTPVADSLSEHK
ncbi:hypothetical protein AYJ08_04455 [Brevibacillus sp. SKDU10]|uniref:hypothetical protein n=1 Tax=Brevibacillus sp. SKDU10 TaxID=1247872 RepID=UPI0007C9186C|nr:hypothetical protein [Brevibacillus sp. SKDU10]OAJ75383.1 hypothetical protein AYJ08_04455 [Brevibacillus sp. SKDU10]